MDRSTLLRVTSGVSIPRSELRVQGDARGRGRRPARQHVVDAHRAAVGSAPINRRLRGRARAAANASWRRASTRTAWCESWRATGEARRRTAKPPMNDSWRSCATRLHVPKKRRPNEADPAVEGAADRREEAPVREETRPPSRRRLSAAARDRSGQPGRFRDGRVARAQAEGSQRLRMRRIH